MKRVTWIDPRDKPGLLHAVMEQCTGASLISFEGSLEHLSFYKWPNASYEETPVLKRQTISPKLDFVILPLDEESSKGMWKELAEKDHLVREGIIHVQIAIEGELVFGGYDNFDKECTVAYKGLSEGFLQDLKERGTIRGYEHKYS
ncbi:hypothetical protein MJO52_06455 [Microbulbifer variabilis]|uniref:Uncharacterized protein n=1 Tax=Microbulbifer variabilis TaxID=266805 RepID=A0ABY4VEN3_9GAMM|nr:hypothetical protein [Microbulbifer variabilis]USD22774.1 hypothetical protein MJO52_06455 [Microbulbifer variabilis]